MREEDGNTLLKNLITIGIILNIFVFNILPLIYLNQYRDFPYPVPPPYSRILFGSTYIAEDIDPQYAWNSASFDAIIMIWEGILACNLSHPEMALYPLLATDLGTYDVTGTELTFNLKAGVKFHDGTDFNTDAVVWSFMRLLYLMNTTWNGAPHPWGPLPDTVFYTIPTLVTPLYYVEGNPIIQNVEAITPTQVKFTLNQPYGSFRALLAFSTSVIMSPSSTPQLDYINPATIDNGTCIGTGPMIIEKLESYELRFTAFEEYHRPRIDFDVLVHVKIIDDEARNMAVLSGAIDIITDPSSEYLDNMEAEEGISLYEAGYEATVQYLGFNNKQINITWRNAISYAINYSSLIDINKFTTYMLTPFRATRLKSPLPEGVLYANWSFNYPIFNVTEAREIMQSMGFGIGWDTTFPGSNETQWTSANFRTLNLTIHTDSSVTFWDVIFNMLEDNLDYIGIYLDYAGMAWDDFKDRLYNRRVQSAGWDALQLYPRGWFPDLNDPSDYLNPLFSNISTSNAAQVNDPYLQILLDQGIEETGLAREAIYDEIQRYLVEELRPHAWLYVERNYDVWDKDLRGFPSNAMDIAYFYPCYWD